MFKSLLKLKERRTTKRTIKHFETTIGVLQEDIGKLSTTLKEAEAKYGHRQEGYDFIGSFIFLRLSFIDILILEKHIKLAKIDAEKNLIGRMLALQLYEFLEDLGKIMGKNYEKSFAAFAFADQIRQPLKELRIFYNSIKTKVTPQLKDIRNKAAAHKDQDALKQLEAIQNIDIDKIENIGGQVQLICIKYIAFEKMVRNLIKAEVVKKSQSPGQ